MTTEFAYELENQGPTPDEFYMVYEPGNSFERHRFGVQVHTDDGTIGFPDAPGLGVEYDSSSRQTGPANGSTSNHEVRSD